MSTSNEKWENVLSLMHQEVTDYQFVTWFQPLKPIFVGDNRIVFGHLERQAEFHASTQDEA